MKCVYEVTIREFLRGDIEKKVAWINDPANNRYLHYEIPLEVEKTRRWFDNKNNAVRWDCMIEADGVPVGLVGLLNIDQENQKAEFYISMGENAYKRKGISSQAIRLVLQHGFRDLQLNKVYLNVDADNNAACSLYEKTGFRCEGVFIRDMLRRGEWIDRKRYAILKEEFDRAV